MDRRVDEHDVYRTITFNRSCNVLKANSSGKKQHTLPNLCQLRRSTLFQFLAFPSPILGTTENAIFAHFLKKSMHLKTKFLLDYQVLFLLLNGPQIEKGLQFHQLSLIDLWDFDRFMTSEGSDTLILPFTSKTGQSVAQNRQKIFLFGFSVCVQ